MKKRSVPQLLLLSLKGMAMGAADVVPGVSGGTIAFISGIYEELIHSIHQINLGALKVWRKDGFKACWNHINGTFFVFLFLGIGVSVVSFVNLVEHLLKTHPVLLWSFFFGLIIASVWLVSKSVRKWTAGTIIAMLLGVVVAYCVTSIESTANVDASWFVVLSGALAICAMILPGISGAFILLLLGSYDRILGAITSMDITTIGLFAAGCLIGLLSFTRLLKFLFENFRNITVAVLAGFMIGSLNKIWPWKETISMRENSHGELVPFIQRNVLPNSFEGDPQFWLAVGCCVAGFLLIFTLESVGAKKA